MIDTTSHAAAIRSLVESGAAFHTWNFFLDPVDFGEWSVAEMLPGFKQADISSDIFLIRNNEEPDKVVKYEVLECASEPMADQVTRSLNARNTSAHRLTEVGPDDTDHKSSLIRVARLAFIDEYEEGFRSLSAAIGNIACRLESIGDKPTDLDDLGDLLPNLLIRRSLESTIENAADVSLRISPNPVKRGETIEIQPIVRNLQHGSYWLLFIAGTKQGAFFRADNKILFKTPEDSTISSVTFIMACFDGRLRKKIALPVTLQMQG